MKKNREKIKVLQITKERFPPEIRVLKEAISFSEAGYKSAVICPPYDNQTEYELWNNIEIFRPEELKNRSIFDKIMSEAFFYSPIWSSAIKKVIQAYEPHALHIHDIWLGRNVINSSLGQKIIFDLHENMPAAVVEYLKGYKGFQRIFRKLFHSYHRIFSYEKELLKRSDLILSVVEEARQRIINDHKELDSEKVLNIENLESKRFISESIIGRPSFGKEHFSLLYIGGFGPHRGVDTLIRAMSFVKQENKNIKIQLIGARPSQYLEMLKKLIDELDVSEFVNIAGWVNPEHVLANLLQADVCSVPHHSNSHTDTTIPHKLYQYMIAKRPVLVSSSSPLARTVRQANSGLVFKAGDPEDCAEKIIFMSEDQQSLDQFAENGYRYVVEQGNNWEEKSSIQLIDAYDGLFFENVIE